MIVVVASEQDIHADAVILALRKKNFADVLRIDLEAAHSRFEISVTPNIKALLIRHKHYDARRCDWAGIKTIWWRRAVNHFNRGDLDFPRVGESDQVETYWAFRWLLESQPEASFPFSHPHRMVEASNKLLQLQLATGLGFIVPETLYTNNRDMLLEFAALHGNVVLKPLRTALASDQHTGRTINVIAKPITSQRLGEVLARGPRDTSAFCQRRILKIADIRVNVLPTCTVACRIATGELPDDEVDWRPQTSKYAHALIEVPDDIDRKCRQLLQILNLRWGAFDFGLTPTGDWVFFECNPNGQWLWIEFKTGAPLSELVATELMTHHEAARTVGED